MRWIFVAVLVLLAFCVAAQTSIVTVNGVQYRVHCYAPNNCTAEALNEAASPPPQRPPTQVVYVPPRPTAADAVVDYLNAVQAKRDREQAGRTQAQSSAPLSAMDLYAAFQLLPDSEKRAFVSVAAPAMRPYFEQAAAAFAAASAPTAQTSSSTTTDTPGIAIAFMKHPRETQPEQDKCFSLGQVVAEYPFRRSSAEESQKIAERMQVLIDEEARKRWANDIRSVNQFDDGGMRIVTWAYECAP